jgi:hypothetical protein
MKEELNLSQSKYLNDFAQKLMNLSNRLNEIEDDDYLRDDIDIKEDYLPDIREFIFKVTGL